MRLRFEQLNGALKNLAPVYFVSGDEPMQQGEAADTIRLAAREAGYQTREVFSVESGFDWGDFSMAAESLSLFSDKKILDLRLPSGKPGTDGAKALIDFCQRLPEDTLLLITAPKVTSATLKSKWCQALDKAGVILQVWPLQGRDLLQWLQARAQKKGMQIDPEGIRLLAARVEGNLLAAVQEIEKLYILYGQARVSRQAVEDFVADSSRFDVFQLTDCLLAGKLLRAIKILNALRSEGIAAPVVIWAIAREVRQLIEFKTAVAAGQSVDAVSKQLRLWDKRKSLVPNAAARMEIKVLHKALALSSTADRQLKGREAGDCWETMLTICQLFHKA